MISIEFYILIIGTLSDFRLAKDYKLIVCPLTTMHFSMRLGILSIKIN